MKRIALILMSFILCVGCGNRNNNSEVEPVAVIQEQVTEIIPEPVIKWILVESESNVHWTGFKPTGKHWGTVKMQDSYIITQGDLVTSGRFTVDLTSINTEDLKGEMKAKLEAHLASVDFFDTQKYPKARFIVVKSEMTTHADYPIRITGKLQIKETHQMVNFYARQYMSNDTLYAETEVFKIDRTDYGVNHMSKNIFKELKDRFINDEIEFQVKAAFVKDSIQ